MKNKDSAERTAIDPIVATSPMTVHTDTEQQETVYLSRKAAIITTAALVFIITNLALTDVENAITGRMLGIANMVFIISALCLVAVSAVALWFQAYTIRGPILTYRFFTKKTIDLRTAGWLAAEGSTTPFAIATSRIRAHIFDTSMNVMCVSPNGISIGLSEKLLNNQPFGQVFFASLDRYSHPLATGSMTPLVWIADRKTPRGWVQRHIILAPASTMRVLTLALIVLRFVCFTIATVMTIRGNTRTANIFWTMGVLFLVATFPVGAKVWTARRKAINEGMWPYKRMRDKL